MKHRLMDLLACPLDKGWPLKLEIKEETIEDEIVSLPAENQKTKVICNFYCNYKQFMLISINGDEIEKVKPLTLIKKHVTLKDCEECFQIEIVSGTLNCPTDENHKYRIKEGIPIMLSPEQIKEIYGKKGL